MKLGVGCVNGLPLTTSLRENVLKEDWAVVGGGADKVVVVCVTFNDDDNDEEEEEGGLGFGVLCAKID